MLCKSGSKLGSTPVLELKQYFLQSTRIFSKLRKNWKGKKKPENYGKRHFSSTIGDGPSGENPGSSSSNIIVEIVSPSRVHGSIGSDSRRGLCFFCESRIPDLSSHQPCCPKWPSGSDSFTWDWAEACFNESLSGSPGAERIEPSFWCGCGEPVQEAQARCHFCIDQIIRTEVLEKKKKDKFRKKKRLKTA